MYILISRVYIHSFYNILSFGRENKLEQGSDLCFVLCIIIVVEGADDGISLVGGVLYGRGGIVLASYEMDRVLMRGDT